MNILQVVPELSAGGVERTTIEIAQALKAKGHTPHVASLGGRLEDELAAAGGVLHRLDMKTKNPLKLGANTRALMKVIKNNNIDIVHARSRAPAWPAHKAASKTGAAFVTTYHGIYNAGNGLKRHYNAIMTKGDMIIANSQFTCDHIMAEHGTDAGKITVIPRGVDMARFDADAVDPKEAASLRASWGVSADQLCLLLPGRLTSWKGQLVAVKALAQIRQSVDAALVLLGDAQGRDSYVAQINALAGTLGVGAQVKLPGHNADMPLAFMASDMVISASTDPEAFGRIAAEAQAMGRWVIASDHGGARETIINGLGGIRVGVGDVIALAAAVLTARETQPDTAAMRAHIQANFSAAQLKAKTLAVYETLLA